MGKDCDALMEQAIAALGHTCRQPNECLTTRRFCLNKHLRGHIPAPLTNRADAHETSRQDAAGTAGSVSFNNMVEVEALVVPVCPVHHGKFMQYEALSELLATRLALRSDSPIGPRP